jgi:hypothetical protein
MIIIMTIDGTIVDQRVVPSQNLTIEGYLQGLQNDMIEQNEDFIDLSTQKPEFILQTSPIKKVTPN